jgi:undecaprenyl phosphate N,N'-diacetylbacillosamine 1-phosphate transferase
VMAATAAVMAAANRASPFFLQQRVGKDEETFTVFKIRTMKDTRDAEGNLLPDEERTTRAGAFVRRTRLDELPQVFNILKGDMSIVGPRPLEVRHAVAHDPVRCRIQPGLTGLAQVFNMNGGTEEQALMRDRAYAARLAQRGEASNLLYDLKLVVATPLALIEHRKEAQLMERKPLRGPN